LNTKALILSTGGRHAQEVLALLRHALALAEEHQSMLAALRAYNNLVLQARIMGRLGEARQMADRGLALARRLGMSAPEWHFMLHLAVGDVFAGEWDQALRSVSIIPPPAE